MNSLPTVYVVDDEAVIRDSFEMYLNIVQVPVRTYPSADDFLEMYDEAWTGLLIADIRMTGMNGLELVKQLRARNSSLSAVLMTGNADDSPLMQVLEVGAVALLHKPFSVDSLKEILKRHFPAPEKQARR